MKKKFYCLLITFLLVINSQTLSAAKGKIKLNLNDVEVLNFIKILSKQTGRAFVFDSKIMKGKRITLLSTKTFTSSEVYKIFQAVLNINGLSIIEEGKITRIMSSKDVRRTSTPLFSEDLKVDSGSHVTRVIPVKYVSTRTIRASLQPLISKDAILVGNDDANILILRDTKENAERFAKIVELIDKTDILTSSINAEIVVLKHADATETAALLNRIFTVKAKKGTTKQAKIIILGEKRTNNLILVGPPGSLEKIKQIIKHIDQADKRISSLNMEVINLTHADAAQTARLLNKIFITPVKKGAARLGKIIILDDARTNNLILIAPPATLEKINELIRHIDKIDKETDSLNLEIVALVHADAVETAALLNKIFATTPVKKKETPKTPKTKILGYKRTNNLVLIGHPVSLEKIKKLIKHIDQADKRVSSLNMEVINLTHADATQTANLLNKIFVAPVKKGATKLGKIIIVDDARTNNLILIAPPATLEKIKELIRYIDKTDKEIDSWNLEVVALVHADAVETAALLNKIFVTPPVKKKEAPKAPKIIILGDKRTNNLVLIGHPVTLEKIKKLIEHLDKEIKTDEGNIRVYRLNNANAEKVAEVLQKIVGTVKSADKKKPDKTNKTAIFPDIPSNSLVIFADQADFPIFENVINQLDIVRPQVFIQALIMEMRLDKSLDLGIDWQYSSLQKSGDIDIVGTVGGVGTTGSPKTLSSVAGGSAGAVVGMIGGPITFGGTQFSTFNAFIKAMEQDTEIDILSNPQILTLNNEEAEIKVGEIIPTMGATKIDSSGNITTTIDYKEVGISLKITPQINSNDSIELKIEQTSSNVVEGKAGAFDQPAITTLNRSLKTTVVVENGQTIVLGGLISDEITEVETRTPCLGDIPVLGWLFKSLSTGTRKTNLLIFITPHVVRTREDLEKITQKAKTKIERSRRGNFRIDVSKEFNISSVNKNAEESEDSEDKPEDSFEEKPDEILEVIPEENLEGKPEKNLEDSSN